MFRASEKKNEIFMCDFILFLKNKIRAIFHLEYMCSVFTFVQYTLNKKENDKLLLLVKMADKHFYFNFFFEKKNMSKVYLPLVLYMCFEQVKTKK